MVIILLYAFPALWLGGLFSVWLLTVLAEVLLYVPAPLLEGMTAGATFLFVSGVLFMLGGHAALSWEMLANKNTRYNLDAITTYAGSAVVGLALLLLDWSNFISIPLLAILIAPNIAVSLVRVATLFTRTAMGTLALLFSVCALLLTLTWFTLSVI